jgi:hypothetical protein
MFAALKMSPEQARWPQNTAEGLTTLSVGAPFETPENLFTKLDDAHIADWEARFGGGGAQ